MKHLSRECKCGCGEFFHPKRTSMLFKNAKHCHKYYSKKAAEWFKSPFEHKNNPIYGKSQFIPTVPKGY
jgi:hypothetical protein